MRIALFAVAALIAGCATQKTTHLPDGSVGHSINCSGQALNWGMCYEKAGEICGKKGYEVVSKEGDATPTATVNQYGGFSGAMVNRSLLVKCKE
jgi:hypothetical protein